MNDNETNLRQSLLNVSDIYHWTARLIEAGLDPALGTLDTPLERADNNLTRWSSRSLSQPDGWLCWRMGLHYIPPEKPEPWKSVLVAVDLWPNDETLPQLLLVGVAGWSKPPQAVGAWNIRFFEERLGIIKTAALRLEYPAEGVVSVSAEGTAGSGLSDGFVSATSFATPLLTLAPSTLESRVLHPLRALLSEDIEAAAHALKAVQFVPPVRWAGQVS